MRVIKRNGATQEITIDKIKSKIKFFTEYIFPLTKVDVDLITEQVRLGLHDNISTSEIDVFTAKKCMEFSTIEPEYGVLASRILVNNHHKNTLTGFKDKMEKMYRRTDPTGKNYPLIDRTFFKFVSTNQRHLEAMIDYQRDYLFDTFGFLTLEGQYLVRINDKVIERPQDIFMREAITLCMNSENFSDKNALEEIHLVYDLLSTLRYTYATPTMNNSGMIHQQLSSCFLLGTDDSLEGLNKTMDDAAKISKFGGGIGIHMSNIRSAGQLIRGTNGKSSGIRNFLKLYDSAANAYNQGGKRNGSFAIYLRDYHPDFMEFISMKNPIGDESMRARNLFYAVGLSDLFYRTVQEDGIWYFIDPEEYEGLDSLFGEEFEKVYKQLVAEKKSKRSIRAREMFQEIMRNQFESGVPYIMNFDHVNRKNNLKHYSTIKSSNLCIEIELPSSSTEYGVCNLCSMVLPSFVVERSELSKGDLNKFRTPNYQRWKKLHDPCFDYQGFVKVVQIVARTMDRVIDRNIYPVKEAMISNLLHRPIGIGSSGLADVFCLLRVPFDSEAGIGISRNIAETIAYGACSESTRLAKEYSKKRKEYSGLTKRKGDEMSEKSDKELSDEIFKIYKKFQNRQKIVEELDKLTRKTTFDFDKYEQLKKTLEEYPVNPVPDILKLSKHLGVYPSYYYGEGAPISKGEFQWKLWGLKKEDLSGLWDWETLEGHIQKFGIRNSLLTAQMPTASTAQTNSVCEGCELFTTNLYRRSVLSGEYVVFNRYLINDLIELNLWDENMKNYLMLSGGSIQNIQGIPENLKLLYKTAWDIDQKRGVDHMIARAPFLDHSQSFNVFIGNPEEGKDDRANRLYQVLLYGWSKGAKSGMYYLRSQPAIKAQQFTIPLEAISKMKETQVMMELPKLEEEAGCLLCGT